jgi:hemin uptake protein HemP
VLDSAQIFQGTREIAIRHGSEIYRLRLTKANKLILHK